MVGLAVGSLVNAQAMSSSMAAGTAGLWVLAGASV